MKHSAAMKKMYPKMNEQLAKDHRHPAPEKGTSRASAPKGDAADGFEKAVSAEGLPKEKAARLIAAHRRELTAAVARARREARQKTR